MFCLSTTVTRSLPQELNRSEISSCRFHPTDVVLAANSFSSVTIFRGTNRWIPFSDWEVEQEFKDLHLKQITSLEWNENGTQLAAGDEEGTVTVLSYPKGEKILQMKRHPTQVRSIVWNPFRQDAFVTLQFRDSEDQEKILLWNTEARGEDEDNPCHILESKAPIKSVEWISANQIALGLSTGFIEIFQIEEEGETTNNRVIKTFQHGDDPINYMKWNDTLKYLAALSFYDQWIKIWSMEDEEPVHSLKVDYNCKSFAWCSSIKTVNEEEIEIARKSPGNLTMACGLGDGSIVIWNPAETEEDKKHRFLPRIKQSGWAESLSFSPDGRFLASGYLRNTLILWSTETWMPAFTVIRSIAINSDDIFSWLPTDPPADTSTYKVAIKTFGDRVHIIENQFTPSYEKISES